MKTSKDILQACLKVLTKPNAWCQKHYALQGTKSVPPESKGITAFCLEGVLQACYNGNNDRAIKEAREKLLHVIKRDSAWNDPFKPFSLLAWNDSRSSVKEVLAALQSALELDWPLDGAAVGVRSR